LKKVSQVHFRIAITGPESTGKSTLARALATHYDTTWVPEYAREYIVNLERPYLKEDLLEIAKGQIASEKKLQKNANQYLFCDTDLTVIKIWSEYKYQSVDAFIVEQIQQVNYDLYLLMDVDLPWKYDTMREHPHKRSFFFQWFKQELERQGADYATVRGNEQDRLQNAISLIDARFNRSSPSM
jgi:NadR type nicotinamide-nucleotide adenylyltransferase